MEPEGSSPHSQAHATCPYPELSIQSTHPHPTSRRSILILSSHLRLGLPSGLIPSGVNYHYYQLYAILTNHRLNSAYNDEQNI